MAVSIRELLENRPTLPAPTAVTAAVVVAALSAIAWQVLHWYGALGNAPASDSHPPVLTNPAVDPLPVILSSNLFGAPAAAPPGGELVAAPREATGFVLRAAFAGGKGGGGAIIENSAGQADWYNVGQSVVPGLTLKEVHPDHVLLDRGGIIERLAFERLSELTVAQANPVSASLPMNGGSPGFSVEPGEPQPIPQDMAPEEKANLIRQRLEELRNRTRK